MKKLILFLAFVMLLVPSVQAQRIAVKTNLVGWAAMGTVNLGVEPALWSQWTLAIDGYYNPFSYDQGRQTKMWGIQPELRYWFCQKYSGHFIGLHGQYADYDYGMNKYRYNGSFSGLGLSYGYSLPLATRWRLEFNLGAGWIRKNYEKTGLPQWEDKDIVFYPRVKENGFGITKAGLNLIFIIR